MSKLSDTARAVAGSRFADTDYIVRGSVRAALVCAEQKSAWVAVGKDGRFHVVTGDGPLAREQAILSAQQGRKATREEAAMSVAGRELRQQQAKNAPRSRR